jgi:hypothetical protein
MRKMTCIENGCHRCALHFCVAWDAWSKMGSEDRYSVGDVSVSYNVILRSILRFQVHLRRGGG